MTQEFKSIEEIKEQVARQFFNPYRTWEENARFANDDNVSVLEDSGAIDEVAKRYAQQYIDDNKELVEMLERVEPMLRERHLYATAADVRELLFKHTTHDKEKESDNG